jgi:hypothetical protein
MNNTKFSHCQFERWTFWSSYFSKIFIVCRLYWLSPRVWNCNYIDVSRQKLTVEHVTKIKDPPRWPPDTLYPQKLALNSPISGFLSVSIFRSLTKAKEFVLFIIATSSFNFYSSLNWDLGRTAKRNYGFRIGPTLLFRRSSLTENLPLRNSFVIPSYTILSHLCVLKPENGSNWKQFAGYWRNIEEL